MPAPSSLLSSLLMLRSLSLFLSPPLSLLSSLSLSSLPLPTSLRTTTPGPVLPVATARRSCCHRCHCHHHQCCGCFCCHRYSRRCRCQSRHHPGWLLHCISTCRRLLTAGVSTCRLFAASCCPPWLIVALPPPPLLMPPPLVPQGLHLYLFVNASSCHQLYGTPRTSHEYT